MRPGPSRSWAIANPAFNYRISESYVASELDAMGEEKFLRERLGVWDALADDLHANVFAPELWLNARDPESKIAQRYAFAFDVAPDSRTASIASGGVRVDGKRRVYRLAEDPLPAVLAWVTPYHRTWSRSLDRLSQLNDTAASREDSEEQS